MLSSSGVMGHELALSLNAVSPAVDAEQFLNSFSEHLLERRTAVGDMETFPIEVEVSDDLGAVYVRIGYLLPKSIDNFYKVIPVTVLELYLIDRASSELAMNIPSQFARDFASGRITPMNWMTEKIY